MLAQDIYGIGFATADQIAQKVGIPRDSLNRARAGIDHVLLEATSDGHCALPLGKLKLAAVKLLEVQEAPVEQALSQMLTSGSLLLEIPCTDRLTRRRCSLIDPHGGGDRPNHQRGNIYGRPKTVPRLPPGIGSIASSSLTYLTFGS